MTKTQIRTKAFRKAKNYMAMNGKQTMWEFMSNKERVLFSYLQSVNEQIFGA